MHTMKLYRALARRLAAVLRCNADWRDAHEQRIAELVDMLPHGSGIDGVRQLDRERTTPNKLVFTVEYHHMNEGMYTHWSTLRVTVKPSLAFDIDVGVTGTDADTRDYIGTLFAEALQREVEEL